MADYRANIQEIGYDDIMNSLSGSNTWADFYDLYLKKIRTALGIPDAPIVINGTPSASPGKLIMLQLPNHDGGYSTGDGFLGFYLYTIDDYTKTLSELSSSSVSFRLGYFLSNNQVYSYEELEDRPIYKMNGSYASYQRSASSFTFYRSSEAAKYNEKIYILLEKKAIYSGYRFAFFQNFQRAYDLRTADFLDFITYHIIMKMKNLSGSDEKTAVMNFSSQYNSPYAIRLVKSSDWDVNHTMGFSYGDFTYSPIPNGSALYQTHATKKTEICLRRPFTDGYYNDKMYTTGTVNASYSNYDFSNGGNGTLSEYLAIYFPGMTEFKGVFKDGVMIDDKEYYGTVAFNSDKYAATRLLLEKPQS